MRRAAWSAVVLVAAACGGGRTETAAEPVFDPSAPGPVEMPGGPKNEPFPWRPAAAAAAAAVVASWIVVRRARRAAPPPAPAAPAAPSAPGPGPHVRALRRLERLRVQAPSTQDDHAATASILREYVGERFGIRAEQRTTEELLASPGVASAARLADVLGRCDLVKFARDEPPAAARAALLDAAEAFVRETAAP